VHGRRLAAVTDHPWAISPATSARPIEPDAPVTIACLYKTFTWRISEGEYRDSGEDIIKLSRF
jgi:hypothetical protein